GLDDLYEATGDAETFARARRLVHGMVIPSVDEQGSMEHAPFVEQKNWFAPWQEAYVADGLGRFACIARRRGTPDRDAESTLVRMLGFLKSDRVWIREKRTLWGRTYPELLAFQIVDGKKSEGDDA